MLRLTKVTIGSFLQPVNDPRVHDEVKTVSKTDWKLRTYSISIEITSEIIVVEGDDCLKVIATPYNPGTGADVGGMLIWTGDPATPPASLQLISGY